MKKQELANSPQKPPHDQISTPSFLSQRQLLFDFYDKHFLDFLYRFITLAYTSKIIVQFCLIFGLYVNKTIQHVLLHIDTHTLSTSVLAIHLPPSLPHFLVQRGKFRASFPLVSTFPNSASFTFDFVSHGRRKIGCFSFFVLPLWLI